MSKTAKIGDAVVGEFVVGTARITRTATVSGDGQITTSRVKFLERSGTINGDGNLVGTRNITKSRDSTVDGDGELVVTDTVTKTRTTTLETDSFTQTSTQQLLEVFPDERALDVTWDFNASLMAFVTEWLEEGSQIPRLDRDGVGVTLGGSLERTPIDVFVQYKSRSNGPVLVTSTVRPLNGAYHTVTFDNRPMLGADGYYRVGVRKLRSGDTINQVDIAPVHLNL